MLGMDVVMMGADCYESPEPKSKGKSTGLVPIGVGDGTRVEEAIIDKNARIGSNVILSPKGLSDGWADEGQNVYVRDGIVVVVKNALVEDGTKIGHS